MRSLVFILSILIWIADTEQNIPLSVVDYWAKEAGRELYTLTKEVTGFDKLQKAYEDHVRKGDLELYERNGSKIAADFAKDLEVLLQSKTTALRKIKAKAEEAEYQHKDDPKIEKFSYTNVRDIRTDDKLLSQKITFSETVKINENMSFVQVPTNIFAYDAKVLNIVKWSDQLNDVFIGNYNSTPTLLWQYFGSSEGVFRTYPGKLWKLDGKHRDLYDCRKRGWFIQASTSPKDMVIVIDVSGTMIGNNVAIAKIAAISLIDTLQENDFFNVIYLNDNATFTGNENWKLILCIRSQNILFNKQVYYAVPCLKRLVQATKENKEIMKTAIQNIKQPRETDDANKGMLAAINLLKEARKSNETSAQCNQVIVFFSDGVEGDYAGEDTLTFHNKDKKIRVFSFLVGRKKDPPTKAMQKMSCDNRGHFYKIETIGNVWDRVLEYLKVLSRPLALTNIDDVMYTPLYLDASGLGMMITAAVPVFRNTSDPTKAVLLGVAGTDIVVSTLQEQIPYNKLGVHGYGFAINNNGFLLFHPKLRDQTGYLPSPPNVYLEDVELSYDNKTGNESIEFIRYNDTRLVSPNNTGTLRLKRYLIDRMTGNYSFLMLRISRTEKRLERVTYNYYYQPAEGTPFSACIALPEYGMVEIIAKQAAAEKNSNWKLALDALKSTMKFNGSYVSPNVTVATVSPWPYCNIQAKAQETQPYSIKAYPTAEEIRQHLMSGNTIPADCNAELVSSLLLSAAIVDKQVNKTWNLEMNKRKGVESVFVGTSAGYAKSLFTGEKPPIQRDVLKEEFYEHAADFAMKEQHTVVFSPRFVETDFTPFRYPKLEGNESLQVTVSTPIVVGYQKVIASVVGMKIRSAVLNEILLNITMRTGYNCTGNECSKVNCRNNKTHGCYLIDESGYVVAGNGPETDVGKFFGLVQGRLMEYFANVNNSIFNLETIFDMQAECRKKNPYILSDGWRILTPFQSLTSIVLKLGKSLSLFLAQFSLYSLFIGNSEAVVDLTPPGNISCIKSVPYYMLNHEKVPNSGEVACMTSCDQQFAISQVPNTNLALVVVDKKCGGACSNFHLKAIGLQIEKVGICQQHYRYRSVLPTCHSMHPDESKECGGAGFIRPLLWLQLGLICLYCLLIG